MNDLLDSPLHSSRKALRPRSLAFILSGTFLLIGFLFRLQHWPGSSVLILSNAAFLTAYSWSLFLFLRWRHLPNALLALAGLCWIGVLVWGELFNGGHPYNAKGILVFAGVFAVTAAICIPVFAAKVRRQRGPEA